MPPKQRRGPKGQGTLRNIQPPALEPPRPPAVPHSVDVCANVSVKRELLDSSVDIWLESQCAVSTSTVEERLPQNLHGSSLDIDLAIAETINDPVAVTQLAKTEPQKIKIPPPRYLQKAHKEELLALWRADPRVPTEASRRAWANARGLPVRCVSQWFLRKKSAKRRRGSALMEGSYDLLVGDPPALEPMVIKLEENLSGPPHFEIAAIRPKEQEDLATSTISDLIPSSSPCPSLTRSHSPPSSSRPHTPTITEPVLVTVHPSNLKISATFPDAIGSSHQPPRKHAPKKKKMTKDAYIDVNDSHGQSPTVVQEPVCKPKTRENADKKPKKAKKGEAYNRSDVELEDLFPATAIPAPQRFKRRDLVSGPVHAICSQDSDDAFACILCRGNIQKSVRTALADFQPFEPPYYPTEDWTRIRITEDCPMELSAIPFLSRSSDLVFPELSVPASEARSIMSFSSGTPTDVPTPPESMLSAKALTSSSMPPPSGITIDCPPERLLSAKPSSPLLLPRMSANARPIQGTLYDTVDTADSTAPTATLGSELTSSALTPSSPPSHKPMLPEVQVTDLPFIVRFPEFPPTNPMAPYTLGNPTLVDENSYGGRTALLDVHDYCLKPSVEAELMAYIEESNGEIEKIREEMKSIWYPNSLNRLY